MAAVSGLAAGTALAVTAAPAQGVEVNTIGDPGPPGTFSLRDAITTANVGPSPDQITFQAGLSGTISLTSALPVIVSGLEIEGPGAQTLSISGNDAFRVLSTNLPSDAYEVTVSGLTLTKGFVPSGNGGAIAHRRGDLTISRSVISNSTAPFGGGLGALIDANSNSHTSIEITDSTISGNDASSGHGGGISAYLYGGRTRSLDLTLHNSTISGNTAAGSGGGISAYAYSYGFTVCTVYGTYSCDVFTEYPGSAAVSGSITDTTIAGNSAGAGQHGGGFDRSAGTAPATTANASVDFVFENSILADNTLAGAPDDVGSFGPGSVLAEHSLIESDSGLPGGEVSATGAGGNIFGQDPLLATLALNGGPTATQALPKNSPAVDTGASDLTTDQRGLARPVDQADVPNSSAPGSDGSDMGAFELVLSPEPPGPTPPVVKCAGVKVTKKGTAGRNVINGTPRRDVIAGLGGNDTIRGLGGNDLICGGGGRDLVIGGAGKDRLLGQNGPDTLKGGKGPDTLLGGSGPDKLFGGPGRDKLVGGPGHDVTRQ